MALVGANGVGKSTLLKIIAGMLPPSEGAVAVTGTAVYLPQDLSEARAERVAGALGLGAPWEAWKRIRSGRGLPADPDSLIDCWDIEERISRCLANARLPDGGSGSAMLGIERRRNAPPGHGRGLEENPLGRES